VRSEAGQASIELLLLIPGVLVILAGMLYFGRLFYCDVATQMAAYDGARAAVETLDAGRGPRQARVAVRRTLEGWLLNPRSAQVTVDHEPWDRGSRVRCTVRYTVPVGNIPLARLLFGDDPVVRSSASLRVAQYKSRWD
jgi:hypothetical protein